MMEINRPENIEVYIAGDDTAPLLAFLENRVGTLSFESTIVDGYDQYSCGNIKVFIHKEIDGTYISVYIIGAVNWSSDIDLARDIAKNLDVIVRCDPGEAYPNVSPHSSIFVEVSREGEHLVAWVAD
jgi:hypothetical protein